MSKYDKFEGHTPIEIVAVDECTIITGCEWNEKTVDLVEAAPALLAACKRKDGLLRKYKQNLVDFHCADCYDPKIFCVDSCCIGKLIREIEAELNREDI